MKNGKMDKLQKQIWKLFYTTEILAQCILSLLHLLRAVKWWFMGPWPGSREDATSPLIHIYRITALLRPWLNTQNGTLLLTRWNTPTLGMDFCSAWKLPSRVRNLSMTVIRRIWILVISRVHETLFHTTLTVVLDIYYLKWCPITWHTQLMNTCKHIWHHSARVHCTAAFNSSRITWIFVWASKTS